jgi:hypothetical protein
MYPLLSHTLLPPTLYSLPRHFPPNGTPGKRATAQAATRLGLNLGQQPLECGSTGLAPGLGSGGSSR